MNERGRDGETKIVCADFGPAFASALADGWRVEAIWPADGPHTAVLSRDGERRRLTSKPQSPRPDGSVPVIQPEFLVSSADGDAGMGRAGMRYRDLIPSRLGGYAVASHIHIHEGGPVEDWVHFHRLALQFILVRRGWVRVVYEGQGPDFVMEAGDLVLQPPTIRHRVLESSPDLEVVELSIPAEHETLADHDLALPGSRNGNTTSFGGQSYLLHRGAKAARSDFYGAEAQVVGLAEATGGMAEAFIVRLSDREMTMPPHRGELGFGFVLDGEGMLHVNGSHALEPGASFVIPAGNAWRLSRTAGDLTLLWVETNGFSGQSA